MPDFTDLLNDAGVPPERTKLLRHDTRGSAALKRGREWFGSFISYQSMENSPFRSGAEFAAHFIAGPKLPNRSSTAIFVGMTRVLGRWPWTSAQLPRLWLPADILRDPSREEAVDQEWLPTYLDDLDLVVDWGFAPRSWHQWAWDKRKPILSQGEAAGQTKARAISGSALTTVLDEAEKRLMILRIEDEKIQREIARAPEVLNRQFQERLAEIRPEQSSFRRALLARDEAACAVTGCTVEQTLDAAHIIPFAEGRPDRDLPSNGLLLRRDIHRLFDLFLLGFEPGSRTVWLHPSLRDGHYGELQGNLLESDVSPAAIAEHFGRCLARIK